MNTEVMFSSKSNEWETPPELFDRLNKVWDFTLDPASWEYNAKCPKFFTPETNGLEQSWRGETVFCNPPYGRELPHWIAKCSEEGKHATVVMLIPSRTDTIAMHEHCFKTARAICFIKGRLKFTNRLLPSWRADGNFKRTSAPFPSLIAVYGKPLTKKQYEELKKLGHVVFNSPIS